MKSLLCCVACMFFVSVRAEVGPGRPAPVAAAPASALAAVTAADDERLGAMVAADRGRLEAIISDELRYAHSSGKVDSKTSFIESLVSRQSIYEGFEYRERTFLPAGPGVMLMSGRAIVHLRSGGKPSDIDLNFLGVWREEGGRWRFLAWQSCRNPAPVPPK